MKLGFPRAVNYYNYYPFWAGFFQSLDIELVVSPPTNRQIMERALKIAYTETCMPMKILVGHLNSFSQVDGIFLPRMVSIEKNTYLCPKILGLPESVLYSVPNHLPLYSVTVNGRRGKRDILKSLEQFGKQLGRDKKAVRDAFLQGEEWQAKYEQLRLAGLSFEKSISLIKDNNQSLIESALEKFTEKENKPGLNIALIGHPYLVNESYANQNILQKLESKASLYLIENVEKKRKKYYLDQLRKPMFWSHGQELLGAGRHFVHDEKIDGIIYLTCFGCGSDSMIQDFVAIQARKIGKPYMVITIDEHTGEAGVITRLEAFLDMIERRKRNENNLSSYG